MALRNRELNLSYISARIGTSMNKDLQSIDSVREAIWFLWVAESGSDIEGAVNRDIECQTKVQEGGQERDSGARRDVGIDGGYGNRDGDVLAVKL